jgi:hypothetical protein
MYSEESVAMPPSEAEPLKKGLSSWAYAWIAIVIAIMTLVFFGLVVFL